MQRDAPWTVQSVPTVGVLAGGTAELVVEVRNNDPGPEPLRGSVKVLTEPVSVAGWFTVDRPTRSFDPGATERFSIRIAVPADATAGSRLLDVFVVVTDDPSAETTAHNQPVSVEVSSPVPTTLVADRSQVALRAGVEASVAFEASGAPGKRVQLQLTSEGQPDVVQWCSVDRPSRVLGSAPEDFLVRINPPEITDTRAGQLFGVLTEPPAATRVARSGPVAWSLGPAFGRVIAKIGIGDSVEDVALSPDGRHAYVSHGREVGDPDQQGFLSFVDTTTLAVIATIRVARFSGSLAVSPDGRVVYAANLGTSELTAVDAVQRTTRVLASGIDVVGLVVSPDGRRIWVVTNSDTVTGLDATTGAVVAKARGLDFCTNIAMSPDGSRLYVADVVADALRVIDTATAGVLATVPVGPDSDPSGVAVSPDGRRVYVIGHQPDKVSVIDAATNTITTTVPGFFAPRRIAVTPDGRRAYVSNQGTDTLSVIDMAQAREAAVLQIGRNPIGVAVSRDGRRVYVATNGSGTLAVLEI